jgi:hypothetical protein
MIFKYDMLETPLMVFNMIWHMTFCEKRFTDGLQQTAAEATGQSAPMSRPRLP